ncbi:MAG: hypothetical protein IT357_04110 [Gemmatimonadaceae bacterium]|nr:hypothetical protein [Gemmatimonadaceae bacterium]
MKRALVATALVAALGAIGGALGGLLIATIALLAELGAPTSVNVVQPNFGFAALLGAIWGAAAGAILGPVFAWTLLRRAPLWRAVGETAFAAALGTGLVVAFVPGEAWLLVGALVPSLLAALRLRREVRMMPESARPQLSAVGDR